jgi:hypothetical protein
VINTVGVRCTVAPGHKLEVDYNTGFNDGNAYPIPLTFAFTISSGGLVIDNYVGTLSALDFAPHGYFNAIEDYGASSGNGAGCSFNFSGPS